MRRWLFLVLLLLLFMAACSGNQPIKPWADLRLPGITKIPGIEALQPTSSAARVYNAVAYQSQLDGHTTHVLFENGQAAYDMRLDGSQLHPVTLPCYDSVAVTPNGQWVACSSDTGIQFHDLSQHNSDFTLADAGQYPGSPTWAPDGRHLAVITHLGGGCSIGVFGISFNSRHTNLVALLSLPQFLTQEGDYVGCSASQLTWSPDGAQFAFIDLDTRSLYDLSIGSMYLLTRPSTAPFIIQDMTGDQLVPLGRCSLNGGLAWASSKMLNYVDFYGWNIDQIDISTHETTILITQHAAEVFNLSWTSDSKHLLFVLGLTSDELTVPPSQLYVYTPANV